MLKRIFSAVTLLILLNDSSAALLFERVSYNENQVQVKVEGPKNVSLVNSSRIAALSKDYHNLTVDMPSISSELISVFGGGIAVVIVSDGSRYKYHITAPSMERITAYLLIAFLNLSMILSTKEISLVQLVPTLA